ncbi:MAG: gliding motility-associated C-terminal domain-containing protein, partial [Syntrophothermus sp.]
SDGDIITCILLSSEHCVTGNPATSAPITMSVSQALFMSSAISADPAGSICDGTPVTYHSTAVSAGAGVTYDWYLNDQHTGSNDSVLTITPADNDRIYCKVTSAFSCVSPNPVFTDTLTVDAASNLTPQISVTADHATMCPDMPIVFHADYSDAGTQPTLEWMIDGTVVQQDTGTVYSTVTLTSSQEVTCRLTCNLPCATTHEAVSVPVRIPQSSDCFLLYLPTAFTPDGDQLNDSFRVVTDSETVTNFLMVIYDRWGSEVFQSSDILKGWDGTIKGQSPRGGMYSWKITYDDLQSGEHRVQTGTINLLK